MMTPRKKTKIVGRPSLGRSEYLEVRLTPEEKEAFSTMASTTGLSLSDWVRQTLRQVSAASYEDAGDTPPFSQKGKQK